jgi:O-antigen/teichoic acid export membrane protein
LFEANCKPQTSITTETANDKRETFLALRPRTVMQRKFVTNLALVLALNLLIKPVYVLGIDVAVQNSVGNVQYGFYYALFNFSFILNILLDFGITNFNNTNISQNNHLLSKHFSSIMLLRFVLMILFIVCSLTVGLIIHYTADMMKMLVALMFNQILISTIYYLRSNLAGLHLFKTDSIISVLDRVILIGLSIILLMRFKEPGTFEIRYFVYAQTFAYLTTALITFYLVFKKAKIRRLQWRWPFFVMILKKSYPYALLFMLMAFYNRFDSVILERMLPFRIGANEAGIYASGFRLLDASNQIAVLFAGLLLPIFASMIKLKQNVEDMVRLSFSLLVIPAIIVATCCYFYSYEIMDKLYKGQHIDASAAVFRILMCCFIPICSTYIFGTLLTANGNLRQLNIMASIGIVINVVMNIILIPKFQAKGAAISSVTTQAFTALAQIIMAQKAFSFHKNYKLFAKIIAFVALFIYFNIYMNDVHLYWVTKLIISALTGFALAFIFRLISIRNIYRIVKYEE